MSAAVHVSTTYRGSGMTYGGRLDVETLKVEPRSEGRVYITLEGPTGSVGRFSFTMEGKALVALAHALMSIAEGSARSMEATF